MSLALGDAAQHASETEAARAAAAATAGSLSEDAAEARSRISQLDAELSAVAVDRDAYREQAERLARDAAEARAEVERLAGLLKRECAATTDLRERLAGLERRAEAAESAAAAAERSANESEHRSAARVQDAGAKLGRAEEELRAAAAALSRALLAASPSDDPDDSHNADVARAADKRRMPLGVAVEAAAARLAYLSRRAEVLEAESGRAAREVMGSERARRRTRRQFLAQNTCARTRLNSPTLS